MSGTVQSIHPKVLLFPSSGNELFSIQHKGKTHELPCWQKVAIVVTCIVGALLLGVGVLLGFALFLWLKRKACRTNPL